MESRAITGSLLVTVMSAIGLVQPYVVPLLLLDVFFMSVHLQAIANAVIVPMVPLSVTAYIFAVSAIIYASFGVGLFSGQFIYDDFAGNLDDEFPTCSTPMSCFWLVLYRAVPAGDIGAVLDEVSAGQADFIPRVLFDLSFFIWFGIILFNIITGIIVDTFSALRSDHQERKEKLDNECFVCGFMRAAYEDLGAGYSFDTHITEEHNVWNYLQFVAYLREKDPNEYNGVESYVDGMLRAGDLDWVPKHTSWRVEAERRLNLADSMFSEEEEGRDNRTMPPELQRLAQALQDSFTKQIARVKGDLEEAIQKIPKQQQEGTSTLSVSSRMPGVPEKTGSGH